MCSLSNTRQLCWEEPRLWVSCCFTEPTAEKALQVWLPLVIIAMIMHHHRHRAQVMPYDSHRWSLPATNKDGHNLGEKTKSIKVSMEAKILCVYLDHRMQRAGEQPPELSSDVQQVHLTASHHHSDQGVIVSACTLSREHTMQWPNTSQTSMHNCKTYMNNSIVISTKPFCLHYVINPFWQVKPLLANMHRLR